MPSWWDVDRTPFPVKEGDTDYSGEDFISVYLADSSGLTHSFLNGTTVTNAAFVNSALDQCELAEANFTDVTFSNIDFTGSDFVRTTLRRVKFENCAFTNGEWRETDVEDSIFIRCNFSNTTINLCTFSKSEFLSGSNASMNHKAINYNTFSRCTFADPIISQHVLSQNFGLPTKQGNAALSANTPQNSLAQICLASGTGRTRVEDLILAIEHECTRQKVRSNKFVLEFMAKIVSALSAEDRISPSSLTYVEELFSDVAKSTTTAANFQAAMNAVISVRNAIYDTVSRHGTAAHPDASCKAILLSYGETFERQDATDFGTSLSEILFGQSGLVSLSVFRTGSTYIEYALVGIASITSVISVLNLLLIQANITVRKSTELSENTKSFLQSVSHRSTKERLALPEKLPAVLRTGAVVPQLRPVRIAIQKNGETLIRLDDRVEITVVY